jgi:hypothetical protein
MILVKFSCRTSPRIAGWLTALFVTIVATVSALAWDADPVAAQGGTAQGFCTSELSETVVYVSTFFDTKLNPKVPIVTRSIEGEFHEYLKGRYNYKSRLDYPVHCGVRATVAEAEAMKGKYLALIPPASKQVEVDWKYLPDSAWVAASFVYQRDQGSEGSAPPRESPDFGYCFAGPPEGPLQVSAVFDGKPMVNLAQWQIDFSKYLGPTKGFIGTVSCRNGSKAEADRMVKARSDGTRAAGRAVVETGWKPGAATTVAAAKAKPDDDREPAAAKPPAPPSAAARDFATKEMPEVMAMCNNDRMISGALDCQMVARVVYNYRLAHWSANAPPEPLAQLLASDKLDCTQCVKQFVEAWAVSRAQSTGYVLPLAAAQCVGKHFAESIRAKPSFSRVQGLFDAAVKACKK